ncbi:unnamed protein product [Hermetia illucens]|uniref:alpha-glucosidase n=1 Tax=Hermetia illucens TaxID=343691 RepID=A0A7R8UYL5_HERIL|nr:maltase A3-like isoform X3 [Hermetia illucens]CAD7089382.1 unnamed protein product [Hermetia illucens]
MNLLGVLIVGFVAPCILVSGAGENPSKDWWETASIYQIYPRSFKDSNGDGIGDLKGITQMLPYLKEIGVDVTWLSPIFKSPMADFGYDISDFFDIQPEYGTLKDLDDLIATAKQIGIKVLLDLVPNHSSDENEWFIKSLKKERGYEDFYVWHPGYPDPKNATNRLPPSNWVSDFRYSAWTWREERQEFYLHQFHRKQPDFNYRNPAVVQQMKNIMRFWLKRGIDGFRIDAVPFLFEVTPDKNGNYPNEPLSGESNDPDDYNYVKHIYTLDQPETTDMVYQWRQVVDEFQRENGGDTRILLTEAYSPLNVLMQYYGNGTHNGSHVPFNFHLITELNGTSKAPDFENVVNTWINAMPAGRTANWVLGNHDQRRVASRYGVEKIDLLNMLLMILPGVAVNYNGEEIGMTDVWISWQDTVDPQACNTDPAHYNAVSRDVARTPFQWNDEKNSGFSTGSHTWLPMATNYTQINVETEREYTRSHLNTYKRAKQLRRYSRTFQDGDFKMLAINENIIGIRRSLQNDNTFVMVANVGSKLERVNLLALEDSLNLMEVVLSSDNSPRRIGDVVHPLEVILLPSEALYLRTRA